MPGPMLARAAYRALNTMPKRLGLTTKLRIRPLVAHLSADGDEVARIYERLGFPAGGPCGDRGAGADGTLSARERRPRRVRQRPQLPLRDRQAATVLVP